MSFELRSNESLRKGLRRVLRKQISGARKTLSPAGSISRDKAIHDARKSLKRSRAVLRMVLPEIGEATFREANQSLRDAGRPLSELRDAKVLLDTLNQLEHKFSRKVARPTWRRIRRVLEANARRTRRRAKNKRSALAAVAKMLRAIEPAIKEWTDVPNKWNSLGDGTEQTFSRASKAYAEARADQQVELLHDWRKQAKYLRYQLELLIPIWPERMQQYASEARAMGDLLGDDHDLALLAQVVKEQADQFDDPRDVELLLALVNRRQKQLRAKAMLLGQRFFEADAEDFVRLLKGYWRTWQLVESDQDSGLAALA